jgi:hypothetical protein
MKLYFLYEHYVHLSDVLGDAYPVASGNLAKDMEFMIRECVLGTGAVTPENTLEPLMTSIDVTL